MNKAFQLYTDFVSNNWDFDSLNKEDKSTIIHYVATLCSPFVSNNYYVRVTEKDIIKHLHREINIFVLEEHIFYPTKDSPKEIRLGGYLWRLDINNLKYVKVNE